MRRQTVTCGVAPAGSSRALRLDPLSLPVRFDAHDPRADGHTRQIELHRERVVLRRAIRGMQMAVNVRVSDFAGIALRGDDEAKTLVLVHRDPSLSVPLLVSTDGDEITEAWARWSEIFALPQLDEGTRKSAPRRRRRNAIRARRPKFLMRRRAGIARELSVHRGEREIIARN
ncbi:MULTISPECIES: DUF6101 family protein [unclassified Bradyrhizobium]|uniref:DUF6101 family protein n=1 Tax=unclassified Bradyrhizobium TaxID=2631580 RepID=UPI00247AF1AF|nr:MULTISPECIES: DUF6101 family protein [unclassified Bradyrhizobium]WGR72477.1 DUF6101 family protein [Bradyrhizobium sp. ISRA426]WGR77310.1 DUF6101 family protein [Bradyrhizobium sp. ISRA430]WGR87716.1 DUF6101 family protein [Bradyrhizobium sp. ISRA432]